MFVLLVSIGKSSSFFLSRNIHTMNESVLLLSTEDPPREIFQDWRIFETEGDWTCFSNEDERILLLVWRRIFIFSSREYISTKIDRNGQVWRRVLAACTTIFFFFFSPRLCALTRWPLREVSYTGCRCEFTNKQGPVPFHWTDLLDATGDRPSYRRKREEKKEERKEYRHGKKIRANRLPLKLKIIERNNKKILSPSLRTQIIKRIISTLKGKQCCTNPWIGPLLVHGEERGKKNGSIMANEHLVSYQISRSRIYIYAKVFGCSSYDRATYDYRWWNTGGIRRSGR